MRFIKEPKWCYFDALYNGQKVPRKIKRKLLDRKLSGCALRRLIKSVSIIIQPDPERPSYPYIEVLPYLFCPNCGESGARTLHRDGYYPEVYDTQYCLRCGKKVAEADNSPMIHVLQYDTYADL